MLNLIEFIKEHEELGEGTTDYLLPKNRKTICKKIAKQLRVKRRRNGEPHIFLQLDPDELLAELDMLGGDDEDEEPTAAGSAEEEPSSPKKPLHVHGTALGFKEAIFIDDEYIVVNSVALMVPRPEDEMRALLEERKKKLRRRRKLQRKARKEAGEDDEDDDFEEEDDDEEEEEEEKEEDEEEDSLDDSEDLDKPISPEICEFLRLNIYHPQLAQSLHVMVPHQLHRLALGTDTTVEDMVMALQPKTDGIAESTKLHPVKAVGELKHALRTIYRKLDVHRVEEEEEVDDGGEQKTFRTIQTAVINLNAHRIVTEDDLQVPAAAKRKSSKQKLGMTRFDTKSGQIFNKALKVGNLYAVYKVFCDDETMSQLRNGEGGLPKHVLRFEVYSPSISNTGAAQASEAEVLAMIGGKEMMHLLLPENSTDREVVLEIICSHIKVKDVEIFNHMVISLPVDTERAAVVRGKIHELFPPPSKKASSVEEGEGEEKEDTTGSEDEVKEGANVKSDTEAGAKAESNVGEIPVSAKVAEQKAVEEAPQIAREVHSEEREISGTRLKIRVFEDPDLLVAHKRRGLRIEGIPVDDSKARKVSGVFSEAEIAQSLGCKEQQEIEVLLPTFLPQLYVQGRALRLRALIKTLFKGECFVGEVRMIIEVQEQVDVEGKRVALLLHGSESQHAAGQEHEKKEPFLTSLSNAKVLELFGISEAESMVC